MGFEYRKFKLEADFGDTLPGGINTGRDFLFATDRGRFRASRPAGILRSGPIYY